MTTTPTERRLAITPGPSTMNEFGNIEDANGDGLLIHGVFLTTRRDPTAAANAQLFLDAHNTANACDMLPSELLAKLREAVGRLEILTATAEEIEPQITRGGLEEEDAFIVARQQSRRFLSTLNLPKP